MATLMWVGPFIPDQLFVPGPGWISVAPGQTVDVSTAVALSMLASDASWWTVVAEGGAMTLAATSLAADCVA